MTKLSESSQKSSGSACANSIYALVTPAKDEEDNLPRLIESIRSQSHPPSVWVVVDDGSTDSTPILLEKMRKEIPYLRILRYEGKANPGYDRGFHYSFLVKQGFDYLLAGKAGELPEFIGIVDADMSFTHHYFEELLARFREAPSLGIASGVISSLREGHLVKELGRPDLPRGSGRLVSLACLRDSGGYQVFKSMDCVMNIKAWAAGWETRSFSDLKMFQSRVTATRQGYWDGSFHNGEASFYRGIPFYIALMKAFLLIFRRPYYTFIPYLEGYLFQMLVKKERILDQDVLDYYRGKQMWTGLYYFLEKRRHNQDEKAILKKLRDLKTRS